MANIWSLTRSETDYRPPSIPQGDGIKANSAEFLELRTEAGAVYLRPSRCQRLRLRWAFRHFRVLSPQVLSRRDRSLIGKLSRSARITPVSPLPESTVFGVVEEPHFPYSVAVRRSVATRLEDLPDFEERIVLPDISGRRAPRGSGAMARGSVAGLVALSAACAALILARVFGIFLLPGNASPAHPQTMNSGQASDSAKAEVIESPAGYSVQASPATPSSVSLERKQAAAPVPAEAALVPAPPPPLLRQSSILSNETGQPAIASGAGAPTPPTPVTTATPEPLIASRPPLASPAQNQPLEGIAASSPDTATAYGTPTRLRVSALPQSHVIYPVVSNPDLVGNVDLEAVIGADGTVKRVTVLSGNPKLAEAAIRAVRQWRYSPHEVLGHPVEVETNIKISFRGEDAVSISSPSVAAGDEK
jgi:TonB family protein